MEQYENMDIEEMLNNPLKHIDPNTRKKAEALRKNITADTVPAHEPPPSAPVKQTGDDRLRMERNHPAEDRMLSLEKNAMIADRKIHTLKRIIEEQNERIGKIEEELAILRGQLKENGDDTGSSGGE